MEKTQIILLAAILVFLAFRLYQKYIKKNKINSGTNTKTSAGSAFSTSSKDDDYEPYAKK
jgi:Tfp pilus assembly major pilin PilA